MPRKKQTLHASGLVEVKTTVGKTIDGKRIQKSFYGHSKLEARQKADDYILEQEVANRTGTSFIAKEYTFAEWANKWLETYKKEKVQLSTYNAMEKRLKKYILPYFDCNIEYIKPIDIQRFYDSQKIKPLSSSVKSKIKVMLNGIFESGIDNEICTRNPARNIKLPTYQKVKEKNVYSIEEQTLIIDYIKTHDCRKDIAILLKTGLRRGELLALTWEDIDTDNNIIIVNKALKDTSGVPTVGEPKTQAGYRQVPFDDELKDILLSIERKSVYVCPAPSMNMYLPTNWSRRVYNPIINEIIQYYSQQNTTLKKLSPHELRHSFGTSLYDKGVDLRTIQKVMGHADLDITSNLYVHDNMDTMKKSLQYV